MAGTRVPDTLASGMPHFGASALAAQAAVLARPPTIERRMADAIRALAIDAAAAAGSGESRLPLRMADAATALWTRALRFDASDPSWPDRDRFVLSAGHGAMLLYSVLHLTGHAGMDARDLMRFRQLDSPATGHPEWGSHPAVEATTGPAGQGLAMAVGLALAERMMAARFGRSLVDHRTWVIACPDDLVAGVSHEAAELAGHLRLEKLTVLWDDRGGQAGGQDTARRLAACGWAVKPVDGHDPAELAAALTLALRSRKPTLIACRTAIGACPDQSAEAIRGALGWAHAPFVVPPELGDRWTAAGSRGGAARRSWLKRLAKHPLRAEFERVVAGRLPQNWHEGMAALRTELAETGPALSTREAGQRAAVVLAQAMPELAGGSAGLTGSALMHRRGMAPVSPGSYGGRYVQFGQREHGMAACLNGMALHGGVLPCAGAALVYSDQMRPALRLAALMRLRLVHVLTDDSIGLGQDGPARQPVEQLAALRAMPGVHVLRPADAVETAECWELAARRLDGPSLLVMSRQPVPALRPDAAENRCARGGYVLQEADGPRRATLVATGSEVAIAVEARRLLAEAGIAAAVVSLPCWELFGQQDEGYRFDVLGAAPRFGIEAACGFGWERWLGEAGMFIGMASFGASAPSQDLYRHFGITPEAITAAVGKRLLPN